MVSIRSTGVCAGKHFPDRHPEEAAYAAVSKDAVGPSYFGGDSENPRLTILAKNPKGRPQPRAALYRSRIRRLFPGLSFLSLYIQWLSGE
jgi:hypothetical protein